MADERRTPDRARCGWVGDDPLMRAYHDLEWGVPCHEERGLFERLMLEGFQAGLSWSTILRKREHFRRAFEDWDPERIASYGEADVTRLLADAGIVRNRLKVVGAIRNARALLRLRDQEGAFDRWVWEVASDGANAIRRPLVSLAEVPSRTPESDRLSRELRRRGFTFVGGTICYAFMQSVGIVDDHVAGCFRATDLPAAGSG